ncbi:hypothetical protein SAMN05216232_3194 [Virgibacillus subterraneus]|uniref:HlyD family secretion protein n=1 Tax=Virgibacillus subterraneus TaxID=621109 RepID=A0A1H9IGA1_9BACI|nr:hypothetical protein [Virgibacillus subterraneus]SEQ73604.1 hypothetical protein SAMN05216232_3194 [Virgibacillus subterraneus]
MKRYWKLIAITSIVVFTVGTFYINSALSANSYPEIVFEKVSGNEEELDSVIINGNYRIGRYGTGESVQATAEGSTYRGELSFFERMQGMYSPEMSQLQDKYRNFMRGKNGVVSSYYNTKDTLAYVDIINQRLGNSPSEMEFDIEVLNKESNETISFNVPVPNRAMYMNVHVEDVQMIGGELKVVTQNNLKQTGGGFGNNELHLYSFNLSKKNINGEEKFAAVEQNNNNNMRKHIGSIRDSDALSAHKNIVFSINKENIGQKPEGNMAGEVKEADNGNQQYFAYNLETGEKKALDFPKKHQDKEVMVYDGSILYLMGESEDGREFALYNTESKSMEDVFVIPSQSTESIKFGVQSNVEISDGKMYVLNTTHNDENDAPSTIMVIDAKSGDILYEGKITTKEPTDKEYRLAVYGMEIK